jgi:hypothetical protein
MTMTAENNINTNQDPENINEQPVEETAEETVEKPAAVDASPSEKLMAECCGCRLSFSWFAVNRGFDTETKNQIAMSLGIDDVSAVSAGKRLYDTKHPLIRKANEIRTRIGNYWTAMTLPMAQSHVDEIRIEGGVRLIRRDQIDTMHNRMTAFLSEAKTIEAELNLNRHEILEASQQMLGDKFDAKDYPETFKLAFRWGFPSVEIPAYLEKLAPAVYQAELTAAKQRFENTYELATVTFMSELKDVIATWVDRLGPVTRLYPPLGHPKREYFESEVLARVTHQMAPNEVPQDMVKLQIRLKQVVKGVKEVWTEPMTMAQYNDLKPTALATEKKTFRESTVTNLFEMLARFRNLGGTMSASKEIEQIIDAAQKHLSQVNDPADAADELRKSRSFRQTTHNLMAQLNTKLDDAIVSFTQKRRTVIRD